jgi:FkbM family methyltransferase
VNRAIYNIKHYGRKILAFFHIVPGFKNLEERHLYELDKRIAALPVGVPGEFEYNGWKIHYLNPEALRTMIRTLIIKQWNDFVATRDDPLILDCGANIGVSVLHYKRLYPKARIIAFEPDPDACAVLRKNLQQNGVEDVTVVQAAVWTEEAELEFMQHEFTDSSRLVSDKSYLPKGELKVRTVRLADYLQNNSVDFIKMDIEGAETEVIKDCSEHIRHVPQMVIEYHYMKSEVDALSSVLAHLAQAGFQVTINQYGNWIDLLRKDRARMDLNYGYDQYFLICAWHE